MNTFAVFGDVHGRVALMLTLALRWQRRTGRTLSAILQVGDMGAFPDHTRLDKATVRHAARDPDELGFLDFITDTHDSRTLLGPDTAPPIVFCRGNHEDFAYLERFRRPTALDPWNKLWFIPDGCSMEVEGLRIGGLGGAPPKPQVPGRGRRHRKANRRAPVDFFGLRPRFRAEDAQRAFPDEELDVLLTHAAPRRDEVPWGCPELERLTERVVPRAHLFGHHHEVVGPLPTVGGVLVGLDHLEFRRDGTLQEGAWGVLEVEDGAGGEVGFVWPEDPEVHRDSWRWLADEVRD